MRSCLQVNSAWSCFLRMCSISLVVYVLALSPLVRSDICTSNVRTADIPSACESQAATGREPYSTTSRRIDNLPLILGPTRLKTSSRQGHARCQYNAEYMKTHDVMQLVDAAEYFWLASLHHDGQKNSLHSYTSFALTTDSQHRRAHLPDEPVCVGTADDRRHEEPASLAIDQAKKRCEEVTAAAQLDY